jgi:hypothetical protein
MWEGDGEKSDMADICHLGKLPTPNFFGKKQQHYKRQNVVRMERFIEYYDSVNRMQ